MRLEVGRQYAAVAISVIAAVVWLEIASRLDVEVRWMSDADVIRLEQDSSEFDLTWDAPVDLSHYELFYRQRGQSEWTLYATQEPTPTPRIRVSLPDGEYEFALRWVGVDGRSSPMHLSTDGTAGRADGERGGWYVDVRAQSGTDAVLRDR